MQTDGRAFPDLAALSIGQLRTLARHLCVRQVLALDAQELIRQIETNVRQGPCGYRSCPSGGRSD
jgi:hypothetical protein